MAVANASIAWPGDANPSVGAYILVLCCLAFIVVGMRSSKVRRFRFERTPVYWIWIEMGLALCALLFMTCCLYLYLAGSDLERYKNLPDTFFGRMRTNLLDIETLYAHLIRSVAEVQAEVSVSAEPNMAMFQSSVLTIRRHLDTALGGIGEIHPVHSNPVGVLQDFVTGFRVYILSSGVAMALDVLGTVLFMLRKVPHGHWGVTMVASVVLSMHFHDGMIRGGAAIGSMCTAGPKSLLDRASLSAKTMGWWMCGMPGRNPASSAQMYIAHADATARLVQDMVSAIESEAVSHSVKVAARSVSNNNTLLIDQLERANRSMSCQEFSDEVTAPIYYSMCTVAPNSIALAFVLGFCYFLGVSVFYSIVVRHLRREVKRHKSEDPAPFQIEGHSFVSAEGMPIRRRKGAANAVREGLVHDPYTNSWAMNATHPLPVSMLEGISSSGR